jgi:hypothetical protein
VIGVDGSLTGYSAGIDTKRWLLDFERGMRPSGQPHEGTGVGQDLS